MIVFHFCFLGNIKQALGFENVFSRKMLFVMLVRYFLYQMLGFLSYLLLFFILIELIEF